MYPSLKIEKGGNCQIGSILCKKEEPQDRLSAGLCESRNE